MNGNQFNDELLISCRDGKALLNLSSGHYAPRRVMKHWLRVNHLKRGCNFLVRALHVTSYKKSLKIENVGNAPDYWPSTPGQKSMRQLSDANKEDNKKKRNRPTAARIGKKRNPLLIEEGFDAAGK
jgi:hypothetical protein